VIAQGGRVLTGHCRDTLADRTGHPPAILHALTAEAVLATLDGRFADACALRRRIEAQSQELGIPFAGWAAGPHAGLRAQLYLGRPDDADLPRRRHPTRTLVMAHLGREAEARALLDELLTARAGADTEVPVAPIWDEIPLLEAAVMVRHRTAMELLYERCAASRLATTGYFFVTCVGRHLGAAAACLGMPQDGRRHYEQALVAAERIGFRPEAALIRLAIAELGDGPIAHLDAAIPELRAMDMRPALNRAERLHAARGHTRPPLPAADSPSPDGLTARKEADAVGTANPHPLSRDNVRAVPLDGRRRARRGDPR
jgi:hypothetical protein